MKSTTKTTKQTPSVATPSPSGRAGVGTNNPLNIKHSSDKFQGEVNGTNKVFKSFISIKYGYRAAFQILATYITNGHDTIVKIISRWAPNSENNTIEYINTVEEFSGIPRNKTLTHAHGADLLLIVSAMSFMENGINADLSEIIEGLNLQKSISI